MEYSELIETINMNYENLKVLSIEKVIPETVNQVYLAKSKQNNYIIKKYNTFSKPEIERTLFVQEYLSGFGICPKVVRNKHRCYCTTLNHTFFSVQERIEDERKVYDDEKKVEIISKLAVLHKLLNEMPLFSDSMEDKQIFLEYEEILNLIIQDNKRLYQYPNRIFYNSFLDLLSVRAIVCIDYKIQYRPSNLAIIHGDIRPSNVLISKEGVSFIDFDYIKRGDLLFEIGCAAMLFSNYDIKKAILFAETYIKSSGSTFSIYDVFRGLLEYYVQSRYPFKLIDKILDESIQEIVISRIRAIQFCTDVLDILRRENYVY